MTRILSQLTAIMLLSMTVAFAQKSPVFVTGGKAIRGYDPVAYFTDSKPVLGDTAISCTYDGANWYFANAQNRDAFKADPTKYAPQYGGYCAFGTSQGHKAPTDADAWTIEDGKLYLNYNTKVKTLWTRNRSENIGKANINWITIKDKDTH